MSVSQTSTLKTSWFTMDTIFGYKAPGVESITDKSFILKARYDKSYNKKSKSSYKNDNRRNLSLLLRRLAFRTGSHKRRNRKGSRSRKRKEPYVRYVRNRKLDRIGIGKIRIFHFRFCFCRLPSPYVVLISTRS